MSTESSEMFSISVNNVPYHLNDDTVRLLMGGNQAKQAIPLLNPEVPIVRSGYESLIYDYGCIKALNDGTIIYISKNENMLIIKKDHVTGSIADSPIEVVWTTNNIGVIYTNPGYLREYDLIVEEGQSVKKGDILFKPLLNVKDGQFANGTNLHTAIKVDPYNYEDAVILSETAADKLTSKHGYRMEIIITDDEILRNLDDENYRIMPEPSQVLQNGDLILSKGVFTESTEILFNQDKFIKEYLSKWNCKVRSSDLYINKYSKHYSKYAKFCEDKVAKLEEENKALIKKLEDHDVPSSIIKSMIYKPRYYTTKDSRFQKGDSIARVILEFTKRIELGDKISNRHGNKGVISKIEKDENMPMTKDGRSIEILLNPLGIISRMNIGQLFELHVSKLIKDYGRDDLSNYLHTKLTVDEVEKLYAECGATMKEDLTINGRPVKDISTGYMFIQKLYHNAADKLSARSIGNYSTKSNRPIGGKSKIENTINSAQRLGEMEILCLLAYGAENVVKEFLTIKSSDSKNRQEFIKSILTNNESNFDLSSCHLSEDLNVYLKAMGFKLED